jgi:hypothetical protein
MQFLKYEKSTNNYNYFTFWSCDMVMDQAKRSTVELPPIHEIETRIEYHDTVIKQFETKVL